MPNSSLNINEKNFENPLLAQLKKEAKFENYFIHKYLSLWEK
jgi:hypothetical protein